jgi:hypothetical protein
VSDVKERIRRELERLQPSAGGLEGTLRRASRRERNRRVGAGALSLLLTAAVALGVWSSFGRQPSRPASPSSPTPDVIAETRLFLAGSGEMWIVDVETQRVRHLDVPQLSPGDPPYRIVNREGGIVLWGYTTYVLDKGGTLPPRTLAKDSLLFIPSVQPDRVWAVFGDDTSTVRAVREVDVNGDVTVPDVRVPPSKPPLAAAGNGLVLLGADHSLEVWNPSTGVVLQRVPGPFPVASFGNSLAWCGDPCETLHVTDVATGQDVNVTLPPGAQEFMGANGAFSPDGKTLAVAVRTNQNATSPTWQLALVDVASRSAVTVDGTTTSGYVFIDWAPSGGDVFMTGGERFGERVIFQYRVGSASAKPLPITVGDFYGMAAA